MLDQNTDRMWYVIGAVIVGAALIFILNGTFPSLFASVGESFNGAISGIEKELGPGPYDHMPNGDRLTPTDASLFKFDKATGTIMAYNPKKLKDAPLDVVIPYEIDGIAVEHIGKDVTSYDDEWGFNSRGLTSIVFPNTIKTIKNYAFERNEFSSVIILDSVEAIGRSAFYGGGSQRIAHLVLSKNLKSIGAEAFRLQHITELTLPDSLETIESEAFRANKLYSLSIPKSVQSIGYYAFGSNDIHELSFEHADSLADIGSFAFYSNHLTSVVLPKSVQTVGSDAFAMSNDYSNFSGAIQYNRHKGLMRAEVQPHTVLGDDVFAFGYYYHVGSYDPGKLKHTSTLEDGTLVFTRR